MNHSGAAFAEVSCFCCNKLSNLLIVSIGTGIFIAPGTLWYLVVLHFDQGMLSDPRCMTSVAIYPVETKFDWF